MSEFIFLYRAPESSAATSPQMMQERMVAWHAWMKGLEEKGHLVSAGHPLETKGAVVKDNKGSFNDGPYAETKDIVLGYSIVRAKSLSEAVALSAGCPMLGRGAGGVVEVRPIMQM